MEEIINYVGFLNFLQIELSSKIVSVEVKVIDRPLYCNLILGYLCIYAMVAVVSTYFRMIIFPHKGGIIAIDHLTLFPINSLVTRSVPQLGEAPHPYHHVVVSLLKDSSLMGTFSLPLPSLPDKYTFVSYINMMYYCNTPVDQWVVTNQYSIDNFGDRMSLSLIELDYEAIYLAFTSYYAPSSSIDWVDNFLSYGTSSGPFSRTFSTDENIMDIMMSDDSPWHDHHHFFSFPYSFEDDLS